MSKLRSISNKLTEFYKQTVKQRQRKKQNQHLLVSQKVFLSDSDIKYIAEAIRQLQYAGEIEPFPS